jgi:hypothetical protein
MVEAPHRITQASGDIVRFQVGISLKNLALALAACQEIEDIGHSDSHPTDTGAAPALVWVDGNPVEQVCHGSASSSREDTKACGATGKRVLFEVLLFQDLAPSPDRLMILCGLKGRDIEWRCGVSITVPL